MMGINAERVEKKKQVWFWGKKTLKNSKQKKETIVSASRREGDESLLFISRRNKCIDCTQKFNLLATNERQAVISLNIEYSMSHEILLFPLKATNFAVEQCTDIQFALEDSRCSFFTIHVHTSLSFFCFFILHRRRNHHIKPVFDRLFNFVNFHSIFVIDYLWLDRNRKWMNHTIDDRFL